MKRVLLGMSGGVDSSASIIKLKELGFEVVGLTFILEPHLGADGIFISWPIGWVFGMVSAVSCYKIGRWKKLIGYSEIELKEENA